MVGFILTFAIFTMSYSYAFLHPSVENMLRNSKSMNGTLKINWAANNQNHVSCEAVNLRLKRMSELYDDIKLVQDLENDTLEVAIANGRVVDFILSHAQDFYRVVLDKKALAVTVEILDEDYSEKDTRVIVLTGSDLKVWLGENTKFLEFENGVLSFNVANYEACISPQFSIVLLKDCSAKNFKDLGQCDLEKIYEFKGSLPKKILSAGRLNRRRS